MVTLKKNFYNRWYLYKDPGFGYKPEDELIIPGVEGELIVNRKGSIVGVRITNPGIGFTTFLKSE